MIETTGPHPAASVGGVDMPPLSLPEMKLNRGVLLRYRMPALRSPDSNTASHTHNPSPLENHHE
ncbi:MAG TPA: hypothetical protein VI279_05630 [Rhodocyclaceae bacterium]